MAAPRSTLLRAIDLALATGGWAEAHELVQEYESCASAAWIHAILHKIEGDASNSSYWYRAAGRTSSGSDTAAELAIVRAFVESGR